MGKFMTIQEFAERTGIAKSALRYYESIDLFHAAKRNSSGYRVYLEDQVETVQLISTLRLAEVPIKEIQAYLKEDQGIHRQQMMGKWIQTIKKKRDLLKVSLRYLESDSMGEQIYLIEKEKEHIVWFSAESETGNFKRYFIEGIKKLEEMDVPIKGCYLKYLSGTDLIRAQIGFSVPLDIKTDKLQGIENIEQIDLSRCIAMPFNDPVTKIRGGYQKLLGYATEYEWVPTGPVMEWYHGNNFLNLVLLMPVTQIESRRD